MKKYILIIILIISCLILSGCGKTIKESYYNYEQEHQVLYDHYAIVKEYDAGLDGKTSLVYDLNTRIMYQIIQNGSQCGICEYYINKKINLKLLSMAIITKENNNENWFARRHFQSYS